MESSIYKPSESIQLQRAELSKAFSSLRRTRPRVPFWLLAAHRIPTLWSLYRGIQREAPSEEVCYIILLLLDKPGFDVALD